MRSLMLLAVLGSLNAPWLARAASLEPNPEEVISRFAAKEAEFARARDNYTYRQTVKVQELDEAGTVRGRHEIVSDIIFGDNKRMEKVVRAPVSTLQMLQISPEDEQDLRNVQPFVLTTNEIDKYYIRYLGRQKADEIPAFVFAVKPKKMEPGQRYFEGQIWVDDRDYQIVKTYGRGVGVQKRGSDQQFPRFETYREQIDGKYWFPTYTYADDVLQFQNGPIHMRMIVKYEDYKQFRSNSEIQYGTPDEQKTEPTKPGK